MGVDTLAAVRLSLGTGITGGVLDFGDGGESAHVHFSSSLLHKATGFAGVASTANSDLTFSVVVSFLNIEGIEITFLSSGSAFVCRASFGTTSGSFEGANSPDTFLKSKSTGHLKVELTLISIIFLTWGSRLIICSTLSGCAFGIITLPLLFAIIADIKGVNPIVTAFTNGIRLSSSFFFGL